MSRQSGWLGWLMIGAMAASWGCAVNEAEVRLREDMYELVKLHARASQSYIQGTSEMAADAHLKIDGSIEEVRKQWLADHEGDDGRLYSTGPDGTPVPILRADVETFMRDYDASREQLKTLRRRFAEYREAFNASIVATVDANEKLHWKWEEVVEAKKSIAAAADRTLSVLAPLAAFFGGTASGL